MEIRILGTKDALIYKEMRLEALRDHPEAYSSSYEEEKNNPLESYESRLSFGHFNIFN